MPTTKWTEEPSHQVIVFTGARSGNPRYLISYSGGFQWGDHIEAAAKFDPVNAAEVLALVHDNYKDRPAYQFIVRDHEDALD